ncbi:MAG: hypothetical protein DMG61_22085 [Acidobacteria bacterium]|nr:MAG: hypothetical protein DMG61_22085 [Acidobacteriota bacterium]
MKNIKAIVLCVLLGVSCSPISQAQRSVEDKTNLETKSERAIASSVSLKADSKMILAGNVPPSTDALLGTTMPTPEPMPPLQPIATHSRVRESIQPSGAQTRLWRGLVIAEHSAALFDAWSTRKSITSGNGYERNPLMKPFANSSAAYPMMQIAPTGFDFLSHRMMRSNNAFLRRAWWVPQAASFVGSLWMGTRNIRVADLKR